MIPLAPSQEFQFLVLNTPEHWERGYVENLAIYKDGLQLESTDEFVPESLITSEQLLGQLGDVDLTVGDCSQLYLLEIPKKQIWIFDTPQRRLEPVSCLSDLFTQPTNIAYSPSTIYVADDRGNPEGTVLFAFARKNWQIRWRVSITGKVQDLIADRTGNLYVLLADSDPVIAKFAPSGQRLHATGFPKGTIQTPQAIAITPEQSPNPGVYVLDVDKNNPQVVGFKPDGIPLPAIVVATRDFPPGMQPSGLTVDRAGDLFIGDRRSLSGNAVDDRFIYQFCVTSSDCERKPVAGYRGAVEKLIIDRSDRLYVVNKAKGAQDSAEKSQVHILRQESRFRRPNSGTLPEGIFYSDVLDSATIKQRWHRFVLDAEIPANTQIQVSYVTAETAAEKDEIEAKLRQSDGSQRNQISWSSPPVINPQDALILEQDPLTPNSISKPGRYFWLRVKLIGTDQASPVVRSIRVEFPRRSYLRYLPATYQENDKSRDFLERFLSLFETSLRSIEQQIDGIARFFDGDAIVGDYLRWLVSWLAIVPEASWTDEQLQQLLKNAPQLYQQRGTKAGLKGMIQIFTGDDPLIVEYFQWQCAVNPESTENTDDRIKRLLLLTKLYGNDPFCFCVLLKPFQVKSAEQRQIVRRLIDADKPAHTCAGLHQLQPWVYLDMHTYLGVNTYLSAPTPRLDENAVLGRDTVLTDVDLPPADAVGQIERRSRLGLDTTLT